MLCDYFVLAISALLVWAARFRESATTDIRTEIQRISGSPVTSPEGPTDIIPGVGSQGAVESQSVEPLNSCGAQKPETRSRVIVSSSAGATPVVRAHRTLTAKILSLILHVLVFTCTCSAGVGGWLNENGGCEDGQGSLSVAPASSLSLRFRGRVGEVITTARSPR